MTNYNTQKSIFEGCKPFTLANAYQPRPLVQYLAGDLFKVPPLDVNYGSLGSLRSFGLACLAICVARLYPRSPFKLNEISPGLVVSQGLPVLLDFDSGKRRTHDRVTVFGKILHLPDDNLLFYLMHAPGSIKGTYLRSGRLQS